jgi:hypothetical protein
MALTPFQRDICRSLAAIRIRLGESYVAGGAALNELLQASRISRDIDLFHDTEEALAASWDADRASLAREGCTVSVVRERQGFVEAEVRRGDDVVVLQWTRDSAYRFFPLVEHPDFGLTLHPFDLATNKVLALVGRVEARDFIDTLACDDAIQPLGYLAWAASGKDPGFSPAAVLEHAARSVRYSQAELASLAFDSDPPDAAELSRRWHSALDSARLVVGLLPAEQVGRAVLDVAGHLFREGERDLRGALDTGGLRFHEGRIRGAMPTIVR